jgi:hypothetical protein
MPKPVIEKRMNPKTKSHYVDSTSLGNTIIPIQGMRSNYSAIVRTFIIFMIVKIRRSSVNM